MKQPKPFPLQKNKTKKTALPAAVMMIGILLLLYGAASQRTSLGQRYAVLSVNGTLVGATEEPMDFSHEILETKKAVLRDRPEERLLWDFSYEVAESSDFLTPLLTAEELRGKLKDTLREDLAEHGKALSVTVSVGDFKASFRTEAEAAEFLNQAKASFDPDTLFFTTLRESTDHESDSAEAVLVKKTDTAKESDTETEEPESVAAAKDTVTATGVRAGVVPVFLNPLTRPEEADFTCSGVTEALHDSLNDAVTDPFRNRYETGLVDVDFIIPVFLYTDCVEEDELSDLKTAVAEVTKEEETNKIYSVKAGDTLSGIAQQYGLSLDYLVKLNEFANADQTIHIDQELIVAVPEPELLIRKVEGILYEENFTANPIIIPNNDWYNTKEVLLSEGTTGFREVNAFITYDNGVEAGKTTVHTTVLEESVPEVIERGIIVPPTYIKPISGGRFSSGFGRRWGRMHKGVDWATPTGTTVFASSDGVVEFAGWGNGYGNTILIAHPDGRKTRVAHLSRILVSVGQSVKQGETIGLSGSTGRSTGPHVHFEIYINGTQVNPLDYIS